MGTLDPLKIKVKLENPVHKPETRGGLDQWGEPGRSDNDRLGRLDETQEKGVYKGGSGFTRLRELINIKNGRT